MQPDRAGTNRTYDVVAGLGVEWVYDEPPMERRSHFRLLIGDRAFPFAALCEFGIDRAKRENPAMSFDDMMRLLPADDVVVFAAQDIDADFDPDTFLQVWQKLLSLDRPNKRGGRYLFGQ